MEIAQLSFSEKIYWLTKYRNDLIDKIKVSEKDQKEKDQEIREMKAYFNDAINKLDHMKHDKAYWSGIHGCIKAQMRKEGKYRMELQTFNNAQFGELRTTEIEGKVYYCGTDIARALGYANPQKAIKDHCKLGGVTNRSVGVQTGYKADGTPAMQNVEMKFITEGNVYRLIARSKLPQAEKFESWVFDEILPQIAHTGTYEVSNKSDPMKALELMFAAEKETRGMVHEVKHDFEEFKQDLPLIGEEPDDIRELVNEIALCALGSTKKLRSPAYKDRSVRAKVYSDIWHELKRKFGVRKYKAIKRKYVDDVKAYLTEEYQCPETLIAEIRRINDGKVNETI